MQLFGEIETKQGPTGAMVCVDDDRPREWMLHVMPEKLEDGFAVLAEASEFDDRVELACRVLHKPTSAGSLFMPVLPKEDMRKLQSTTAVLRRDGTGFQGRWCGPERSGAIVLTPPLDGRIPVEPVGSWEAFKTWANGVRQNQDAVMFRGHGDREYRLQTTLHRAGRNRIERYCVEELPAFCARAEAVLGVGFDLKNAKDYATVFALAQHHGFPTPLLDWTESPYVAAFFAFSDALERTGRGREATHVRVFALSREFHDQFFCNPVTVPFHTPYVAPLSVAPIHNLRLIAQQGKFLVTNVRELESYLTHLGRLHRRTYATAVDLPVLLAVEALEDLHYMGVSAATLFPGLDGVCRMMKHQMQFKRARVQAAGAPAGDRGAGEAASPSQPIEPAPAIAASSASPPKHKARRAHRKGEPDAKRK